MEYVRPPDPVPPTVEEFIVDYATEYGVDVSLALSVAWAESRFKNIPNNHYDELHTAYGIFQINASTYEPYCGEAEERKIIEKNIECAMKLMSEEGGINHWSESYEGWRYLPVKSLVFSE